MDGAALSRIEQQRLELEANITKLRKSLRYWQTLEIDYEGLKEEFYILPEDCEKEKYLEAAKVSRAELVGDKELRELIGLDGLKHRSPQRILNLLSRRVDYVSRNVATVTKQLSDAEKKRDASLLAEEPDYRGEAELPLTEITEEFDQHGTLLSTRTETAGTAAPQLAEVFRKAGMSGSIGEGGQTATTATPTTGVEPFEGVHRAVSKDVSSTDQPTTLEKNLLDQDSCTPERALNPDSNDTVDGFGAGGKVSRSLGTPEATAIRSHPDDTEEDAALRREMLDYGLGEVGAIVAQLDLEEDGTGGTYDEEADSLDFEYDLDDDGDDDDDDDDDGVETDDESGMSKKLIVSEKYRKKMRQLEEQLGLRSMGNVGPDSDLPHEVKEELNKPPAAEAAGMAAIARAEAKAGRTKKDGQGSDTETKPSKKQQKSVTFAEDIEIVKEPRPTSPSRADNTNHVPFSNPVQNTVREKESALSADTALPPNQSKKVSRYESDRAGAPHTSSFQSSRPVKVSTVEARTLPREISDRIMSNTIMERSLPARLQEAKSPEPSEIDLDLHRRQIADDYYKVRNRRIYRQGGFVGEGEEDNYGEATAPIAQIDNKTGKVRKVSRFKAARSK